MTSLDDRKQAFENKFKMDEEFRFKINARAVKLMGLWAAEQLGMSGAEAEAYAGEVVDADFEEPGNQDVFRKVQKDFALKGMDVTLHHLENQFNVHLEEAKKALMES
jgi:hypothetical protein